MSTLKKLWKNEYFQTTIKNTFSNWLARSEKYIPFMRSLLKENGLPEDLVYLALIESGFNPYAYSRSKALDHGNSSISRGEGTV
jgi:membrane-bound lytic murein transglycosylase D